MRPVGAHKLSELGAQRRVGGGVRTADKEDAFPLPDIADVKAIRKQLGMSRRVFAETFGLKATSLRNWEQGRTEPEGPAKLLLAIIGRKPKEALEALYL